MAILDSVRDTGLVQGLQNAFQQYGYNRQQGVPLGQGGTGNSVVYAATSGLVGPAQAYTPTQQPQMSFATPQIQGSGYSSNYASNPTNYSPTTTNNTSGGGGLSGTQNVDWYINEFGNQVPINKDDQNQARSEYDMWREQTQNHINSGYDAYRTDLNNLIPYYQNEINDRATQIGQDFQPIFTGLQQARDGSMQKLGMARETVGRKSAESIQDLQQNLNQVMRNTGMQLGAMGAGDTSASQVMAPYAYTKMAGREFGGIQRQANDQYGDINMKEVDLKTEYDSLYNQTELDKNSKIEQIRNTIGDQIMQIRQMITQVEPERQRALAGLSEQLMNEARGRLSGILAEDRAQKQALQQWALQRTAQLNDAKISMSNNANFDPRAITFNEMQSIGMNRPSSGGSEMLNPALIQKRREELGL